AADDNVPAALLPCDSASWTSTFAGAAGKRWPAGPILSDVAIGGISRVFAGFILPPSVQPIPPELAAFITQLLHEVATAVELRRISQFVGRLFRHLNRTYGYTLVFFRKVPVAPAPLVDLQNEVQLFVQRQVAHQFVFAVLDVCNGCGYFRPLLRIDPHDPQFVGHLVSSGQKLAHWWILRIKAVPVMAAPIDVLGLAENGQRS